MSQALLQAHVAARRPRNQTAVIFINQLRG